MCLPFPLPLSCPDLLVYVLHYSLSSVPPLFPSLSLVLLEVGEDRGGGLQPGSSAGEAERNPQPRPGPGHSWGQTRIGERVIPPKSRDAGSPMWAAQVPCCMLGMGGGEVVLRIGRTSSFGWRSWRWAHRDQQSARPLCSVRGGIGPVRGGPLGAPGGLRPGPLVALSVPGWTFGFTALLCDSAAEKHLQKCTSHCLPI